MGDLLFFIFEIAVFVAFSIALRKGLAHRHRQEPNYWWAASVLTKALDYRDDGPPPSPVKVRVLGVVCLNIAAAAIGVWISPHFFQRELGGRIATLVAMPLFLGWFAHGGEIRWERKGKDAVRFKSSTFFAALVFLNLAVRYALISALA